MVWRGAANTNNWKNESTLGPVPMRYHEPIPCQDGMPHLRDALSATHSCASPKNPPRPLPSITAPMRPIKIHGPLDPQQIDPTEPLSPPEIAQRKSPRRQRPGTNTILTPAQRRQCRYPNGFRPPRHQLLLDGQSSINRSTRLRGPRKPDSHTVDLASKTILRHHHGHPRRSVHCRSP